MIIKELAKDLSETEPINILGYAQTLSNTAVFALVILLNRL